MNKTCLFYPAELVQKAKRNIETHDWAKKDRDEIVGSVQPWMGLSDDELWGLMFGNTLKRSWMVWSNGHCPACKNDVPMYNWEIDVWDRPWKLRCPHCSEDFPKNDFPAFYQSGLDAHGVFDPEQADRSLLFHTDHADPNHAQNQFGVDDGDGFRDGDKTWWFIATYLIYGQWKAVVLGGICKLANAYTLTGDKTYAHKAGILLDRVADLYPTFDFEREGVLYEQPARAGYLSNWHDACEEARELFMAYDQVREVIAEDLALAEFLDKKAEQYQIGVSKKTPEDVMKNIETRILKDTLENSHKIQSNYPRQEIAEVICHTVLNWPENRAEVMGLIDEMVETATAVDGVTGEKGLAGYASGVISSLAQFLETFGRVDPNFLDDMLERHPNLKKTYRFHLDTWCFQQYYPRIGDNSAFAQKVDRYKGVSFARQSALMPSMFHFLWRLYERTGDVGYVQALYHENENTVVGLPHDLFAEDCEGLQQVVQDIIDREGVEIHNESVNKEGWHLALLRSGQGANERVTWLDYDTGGRHGHADALNLGLFAKGLDLMPDYGYPPVHRGGWGGDLFDWYVNSFSHNTVIVDGQSQKKPVDGVTKLWAIGENVRAIGAACEGVYDVSKYERTVMMVDVSDVDSYVLDVFRVVGGKDHAKFMHSHFAEATTKGLVLRDGEAYGYGTQMRNFQCDKQPPVGWSVDWQVDDKYDYAKGKDVHVRYTDLTQDAEAHLAESWVSLGTNTNEEDWIPRVMVRRQSENEGLDSTFVGVIEPYEVQSHIEAIQRLDLVGKDGAPCSDACVAVEVLLADGRRDLLIVVDAQCDAEAVVQADWNVRLSGTLCWIRKSEAGEVERVALYGDEVQVDTITRSGGGGFVEAVISEA